MTSQKWTYLGVKTFEDSVKIIQQLWFIKVYGCQEGITEK